MTNRAPVALAGYYDSPRLEVVELIAAQGARVLDVGCASGAMGEELKRRGAAQVVGLEVVPEVARAARERLDAVHEVDLARCPELPYPDGHFDVLVCADVLEHLPDPLPVLRHLARYLHPQGKVVLSLPNVRHESVVLPLLVDGRWQYQDAGILDRTHLRFFTLREMVALMREAGLHPSDTAHTVRSDPSPYLEKACQFVQSLGGDAARFRDEATVVQYLLTAERTLSPSPWEGARAVKVLVAPDWTDPAQPWAKAIQAFAQAVGTIEQVTIGVTVDSEQALRKLAEVSQSLGTGLMAIEAPSEPAGWRRVLEEASVFVVTAEQDALAELALSLKKEVFDGRKMGSR